MSALKNIALLFCLLAAPEALGMHKLKSMRDKNTFGFYTNARMIQALKNNNITRIKALLQRAAYYVSISNKSPMKPKVINTAITKTDNPLEILKLLLDNNAPIDSHAVPLAIELNNMGLLEVGEIKNIIELLLEHKAPLDKRALEKALEWNVDDYVELLLQHKAPVSDRVIESACKARKDDILMLFVKYDPGNYNAVANRINQSTHYSSHDINTLMNKIMLYVDKKRLKDVIFFGSQDLAFYDSWPIGMKDFMYWMILEKAALEKIPISKDGSSTHSFASIILKMPNLKIPYEFTKLLEKLEPKDIHELMSVAEKAERDINQKAFESLLTLLLCNNNEAAIKECYFHHTTTTEFLNKPMVCVKVLGALRKQRMSEKFMHHSMYKNIRFTFK